VMLRPAQGFLDRAVGVDVLIEVKSLHPAIVACRGRIIQPGQFSGRLPAAIPQDRRPGRGVADRDHELDCSYFFSISTAARKRFSSFAWSAVSPVGRSFTFSSSSSSSFLSFPVNRFLFNNSRRLVSGSSNCGGRALGRPKRSLVRIWSTRQPRITSTS